jgi:perosamine synthetase
MIPYGRQSVDEKDVTAVVEVLRSDWLTQGPMVDEFEEAFAAACEAPYAVAFSSGTAALHGCAFAAGLGPGDELVTSAITFAASANCGAYLGATPRFADIHPATWNVSPETLAAAVTERTKAVVPVHFAGLAAPVGSIREAVGSGVVVVEDAAHALGARDRDGPVGACRHSDMTMFSLHPLKTITTAEGGIVTTREPELRDRLRSFRNHGFVLNPGELPAGEGDWYREQRALGFNYRLSDLHAALGRSQLEKLSGFIERRNEVAARYRELLRDIEDLELPPGASQGQLHAYHLFVICHRGGAEPRKELYDGLRARGIATQVHYLPVYLHPWYRERFEYSRGMCPGAESYYAGCLSLPCYPALAEADQARVVESIREILEA